MLQSSGIDEKDVISSVELPEEVSTDEGVEGSDQEKGFDDEEDEKNEKRDEL